ncbi:MAG: hypothetical protein ACREPM_04935, partial [Gemmatimonadaceae bacterium]
LHGQIQAGANGSELSVAVVVPPAAPGIDEAVRVQVESRLSQLLTGTGFAAVPGGSTLVMYPSLVVLEERTLEGLQRRTLVKLDLTLFMKNAADGVLFASTSQAIAGTGPNRNAAIVNAVSSIQGGDPALQQFATSARSKINDYYARNCDGVIGDARTQATTGDIGRAMATVLSVPREIASCHDRANAAAVQIYTDFQDRLCRKQLARAKADEAARRFIDAIDALQGAVDPTSPCAREEGDLLTQIGRDIDHAEASVKAKLDVIVAKRTTLSRDLDSPGKITTRRLSLAAEASVEWFNRTPRPQFSPELFRK